MSAMIPNETQQPNLDLYGCTRKGRDRSAHSDEFLVAELKRAVRVHHASRSELDDSRKFGDNLAHVLLVADATDSPKGENNVGRLVMDEVMEDLLHALPWTPELDVDAEAHLRQELKETMRRCNRQVQEAARRVPARSDMAATMTMAFVRWPLAFLLHAGNCRAYLIRDQEIRQLTHDHTLAQQMVDQGDLDADEAETSRFASILWNAMGGDSKVRADLTVHRMQGGDSLLLCTQPLTTHLSDEHIRCIVQAHETAEGAAEELTRTVAGIGAKDDVTIALMRCGEHEASRVSSNDGEPMPSLSAGAAQEIPEPFASLSLPRDS